jgi:hypothetical protein
MSLTLKIDNKMLLGKMKELSQVKDKTDQAIYDYFKSITPIRSGNARDHTDLVGDQIQANYPYAERLDQGYSPQAPNGMVAPTKEYAKKVVTEYIRNKGATHG